jgi:formate dehydrogenase major subunit
MYFPDYRSVANPAALQQIEALWDAKLDPEPGLTVVEIINAAYDGKIKGMYIMGENPAMSDPDVDHARDALGKLDHLVVQDIFLTETAMFADVVLPASAWPEKSGTVTNTNRQVQIGRKAIPCPGDAREDWWITQELARRLGLGWKYAGPPDVFAEMKQTMPSLNNITWARLEREGAVTYPSLSPKDPGQAVVFGDRFPTPSGRARFIPAEVEPPGELPDRDFPMILSTGRQLEHWHTGAMTRRASVLDALEPAPTAYLHPKTLDRMGVPAGGDIRVSTRRGSIVLAARSDANIQEGMVFIPFAYVEAAANLLTSPQLDPVGKIPEFKFCAAKVEPVAVPSPAE